MTKSRLLVTTLLVVVIVLAGVAAYIVVPSWLPQKTTLLISTSSSTVESGSTLTFSATVMSGKSSVDKGTIIWSASSGSFDKTTGTTVLFTAPEVSSNVSVTLAASFAGDGVYQPSAANVQVTVTPPMELRPQTTTLIVSPSTFQLHGGDSLTLNASLNPSDAPSQLITWRVNPLGVGSLNSTTGTTVLYTAPTVQANTTVTISASFSGNEQYTASGDSSQGNILAQGVVAREPTVVVISPSNFSLGPNGTQVFTASVQDAQGNVLLGKPLAWSLNSSGLGSLNATTGSSVTYIAPSVQQNATVTVVASYSGDDTYLGSSGYSTGVVTPPSLHPLFYTIALGSASMTNVTLKGPMTVNGTSVTMLSADSADMVGISIGGFELTASEMSVKGLTFYAASITGYSAELGGALQITGNQSVDQGAVIFATFRNVILQVVSMSGDGANLTHMEAVGESSDGSEPYVPSILTAQAAVLSNVENITGPVVYGYPPDEVTNLTAHSVVLSQFSFAHPIAYSLNRTSQEYNSTNLWLLEAFEATGSNVSIYTIYFKTIVHMEIPIVATGDENVTAMIPHLFYTGCSFSMINLEAHAVYFVADELTLSDFVFSLE